VHRCSSTSASVDRVLNIYFLVFKIEVVMTYILRRSE
jgi:hypothetical protein